MVTGFDDTTTSELHRTWWATGDPVIMRHALGLMTRAEADIVIAVASDDRHPLQARAIESMGFGFDEAEFVPVLVHAFTHPDPAVRKAAAAAAFWFEPVAAEDGLLAAAHDDAFEVALEALDTLRYYPTQRVLRAVADLRAHPDERIRAAATTTFDELRETFEEEVVEGNPKTVALLREWMLPVRDLVGWPDEISPYEQLPLSARYSRREAVTEAELLALLDNPEVDRHELDPGLRGLDWSGYAPDARARATARLVGHPNPLFREIGCAALADWQCTGELIRLVADPSFTVRKSAMYSLSLLAPDPAVADVAWRYLAMATGTMAQEAVRTYTTHAGPAAVDQLVELARHDRRESVRSEAIDCLGKLHAVEAISGLADLLTEPPGVSWSVHNGLLWDFERLGLTVPIPPGLAAVDNLHVQSGLCGLVARQS
ncbi:hypothetical protein D7D52_24030 [Nocardia yunnanensis]|uniref:HEAT repeat domain-containing protein n=1 Tax=Nocardia yunnanensis TaxID=2382165 RepID=A0A386ZII7_9NOCA|nr:HEAT repeat domain-containing protein [Nocardia yunnanensis]AYF76385.1 hypothetical protein D7D52_24030 [Nocardia yunnanensis]